MAAAAAPQFERPPQNGRGAQGQALHVIVMVQPAAAVMARGMKPAPQAAPNNHPVLISKVQYLHTKTNVFSRVIVDCCSSKRKEVFRSKEQQSPEQ